MSYELLLQIGTLLGIALAAAWARIGQINTDSKVDEVHKLTNSMKDELVASVRLEVAATFTIEIANLKAEIKELRDQVVALKVKNGDHP